MESLRARCPPGGREEGSGQVLEEETACPALAVLGVWGARQPFHVPALYSEAKSLAFVNTYYLIRLRNKEQGRSHKAPFADEEMGLSHGPQVTSLSLNSSPRLTPKPVSLCPLSPPVHGQGGHFRRGDQHRPQGAQEFQGGAKMGRERGRKGPERQAKVGSGLHSRLQEN